MRLLLLLMLTATTFFSQAQQTNAPVKDEAVLFISMTCVLMVLAICTLIVGAVYFLITNNKRRSIHENSNSGKNT